MGVISQSFQSLYLSPFQQNLINLFSSHLPGSVRIAFSTIPSISLHQAAYLASISLISRNRIRSLCSPRSPDLHAVPQGGGLGSSRDRGERGEEVSSVDHLR